MIVVLLDNDLTGHQELLTGTLHSTGWYEYGLVRFLTLAEAGIKTNEVDRLIWRRCQAGGMILMTGNRNQDDPDSLEQTLREENVPDSLPVITVSDPQRISEADYRERCVHAIITIVFDLGNYLGSARQFIP